MYSARAYAPAYLRVRMLLLMSPVKTSLKTMFYNQLSSPCEVKLSVNRAALLPSSCGIDINKYIQTRLPTIRVRFPDVESYVS